MMTDNEDEIVGAQRALQIAFQTMQERCHQLENRLAAVEEENIKLRIEKGKELSCEMVIPDDNPSTIQKLQEKIEELTKEKSQLTHHVLMVAAENRQLWNRLTRLTRTNKSLGNKLIKISDTLKQNQQANQPIDNLVVCSIKDVPASLPKASDDNPLNFDLDNKDVSLEEISLRLINSIMLEKSELEHQYTEMLALQNGADIKLRSVGFAYPDDNNDSLQQLKQYENKLYQTKNNLVQQKLKLENIYHNLCKIKKVSKKVCQTGTQFDSDDSLREHGSTQTSLPPEALHPEKPEQVTNKTPGSLDNICPMCGSYFEQTIPFQTFHEHVLSHFSPDLSNEYELLSP
ncbi:protein spindle-F [Microplitis demolitor]|uniref:protein spindle-F n=1 Tax=Microplitis demolitor TaxID=69319 RepID=UPI0004CCD064|nr:protein spindle-F [Microplitis demolitor]